MLATCCRVRCRLLSCAGLILIWRSFRDQLSVIRRLGSFEFWSHWLHLGIGTPRRPETAGLMWKVFMSNAVLDHSAVPTVPSSESTKPNETPTFAALGLAPEVVQALAKRGVTSPFPIQAAAIPDAISGRDVLGQGRTGSGKTLTFGLSLLSRLEGGSTRSLRPRGVVLVPTRELAVQISEALEPYGSVLGLSIKVVCGGTSMSKQIQALKRGVDIVVATPGRLGDLINKQKACILDAVEVAVLDEADQMADMGFLPEVRALLDLMPHDGQRMLFSATLGRGVDTLVKRYLTNPATHSVDPAAGVSATMTHHQVLVKPRDKSAIIAAIAGRQSRAIVFVRTQLGADRVSADLREAGVQAQALHGGMTQDARTKTLAELKEGRIPVLVATDVAARGIDVDGIDLVLHVDPAADATDYLHRAGRTARAGRSGVVVTLALPHQQRSVARLLTNAGVEASPHVAHGAFDEALVAFTGARSLMGIQAEVAALAVRAAEREVVALASKLAEAERKVISIRKAAEGLSAQAEAELARGIVSPSTQDAQEFNKSRGGDRGGFKRGRRAGRSTERHHRDRNSRHHDKDGHGNGHGDRDRPRSAASSKKDAGRAGDRPQRRSKKN